MHTHIGFMITISKLVPISHVILYLGLYISVQVWGERLPCPLWASYEFPINVSFRWKVVTVQKNCVCTHTGV